MMSRYARTLLLSSLVVISVLGCRSAPTGKLPWTDDHYKDPRGLYDLIAGELEPYLLVDVRAASEYTSGHIPTALNIPHDAMAQYPPTTDKSALIIVYCQSGGRSAKTAETLVGMGYRRVVDFGSIARWEEDLIRSTLPGECPCKDPK